eukprot:gnl/Dysnectes_brevis/499_a552_10436.p1 GENE.gnl/Dysnectes_brevis/499_a552_10436~~gnl/Dysnectes_brevis/499_a552_10436.p1  ORF type:complete len:162 (+),score=39.18 gnl/Dysnectes_brevis/499_a552_10436:59-544(+)
MLLYTDILTKDELFADSVITGESEDGLFYIVEGHMTIPQDADPEDPEVEQVIDIVDRYNLTDLEETCGKLTKKLYVARLKKYIKRISKKMVKAGKTEDDVAAWQAAATKWLKEVFLPDFKNFTFYLGAEGDIDRGMIVLCRWEGASPVFTFWSNGVASRKC